MRLLPTYAPRGGANLTLNAVVFGTGIWLGVAVTVFLADTVAHGTWDAMTTFWVGCLAVNTIIGLESLLLRVVLDARIRRWRIRRRRELLDEEFGSTERAREQGAGSR